MKYNKKAVTADLNLVMVIEDMAKEKHMSIDSVRKKLLSSKTYKCLYSFENGLWKEGPDYIRSFYRKVK